MFPKNLNDAIQNGFIPYILEANGEYPLCTSRSTKINAIIKDFKSLVRQGKNPNEYIDSVLEKYGLSQYSLTSKEINKINEAINGYY